MDDEHILRQPSEKANETEHAEKEADSVGITARELAIAAAIVGAALLAGLIANHYGIMM